MSEVCSRIHKVAPTEATALIIGESAPAKELVARALHKYSRVPMRLSSHSTVPRAGAIDRGRAVRTAPVGSLSARPDAEWPRADAVSRRDRRAADCSAGATAARAAGRRS